MKKTRLMLSIAMLSVAGLTTFTSCSSGGSGDEPCPVGYEGEDCEILSRTKFIGTWSGNDVCGSGTYDIDLTVTGASDSIQAIVNNPGGFGAAVSIIGKITDENTLTFVNQDLGGDRVLNGKMTVITSNMNFDYEVTNDVLDETDVCRGSYTKL